MTPFSVDTARFKPRSAGTASAANEHHQRVLRSAYGCAAPHCDAPESAFALNGRSVSCPARAGLLQFVAGQPSPRLAALDHPCHDCAVMVGYRHPSRLRPDGCRLNADIPTRVVERRLLGGSDGWRGKPPTNPPAAWAACHNLGCGWVSGSPRPHPARQGAGDGSEAPARWADALRCAPDSALIARAGSLVPLSRHACDRHANSKHLKVVRNDDFQTTFGFTWRICALRLAKVALPDHFKTTSRPLY